MRHRQLSGAARVAAAAWLLAGTAGLVTVAAACGGSRADAEGRALLEAKCSGCHSADNPLERRKTKAQWRRTVWAMRQRGAEMTDAEAAKIVAYLTRTRGR